MINDHRQWLYKKDEEARLFEAGEKIPYGWYDSPDPIHAHEMWGDDELDEVPDVELPEIDEPVSDDAPEGMYCAECDKEYKDEYWYSKHMLEKHDIVVKGVVGVE